MILKKSLSTNLAGRSVDGLLGSRGSVNGGHETLDNLEVVVNDLCEGSQAVGGARSVRHDLELGIVSIEVDTDDKHRGVG